MADNVRFLSGGIGNLDKQPITPGNIYFALSDDKTYGYIVYDFKDSDNSNSRIVMSAKAKTAGQVEFPLVIGEHSYDGSERIEIPIYDGSSESGSECFDISILDNMLVLDNDKIWLFKDGKIDKTAPVDFGLAANESIKALSDRLNNIESDYLTTTDKDQVVTMVSNEALERKAKIGNIGDKTVKEYIDDKTYDVDTKVDKLNNLISSEATARQAADDVLTARINTFTSLTEGSTTSDAELADIRVKADGTTADTAGNAVREQISELKGDIVNLRDYVLEPETDVTEKLNFSLRGIRTDNANYFESQTIYSSDKCHFVCKNIIVRKSNNDTGVILAIAPDGTVSATRIPVSETEIEISIENEKLYAFRFDPKNNSTVDIDSVHVVLVNNGYAVREIKSLKGITDKTLDRVENGEIGVLKGNIFGLATDIRNGYMRINQGRVMFVESNDYKCFFVKVEKNTDYFFNMAKFLLLVDSDKESTIGSEIANSETVNSGEASYLAISCENKKFDTFVISPNQFDTNPYNYCQSLLSVDDEGRVSDFLAFLRNQNVLYGKKYIACGDSYSAWSDALYPNGEYAGKNITYQREILLRNNMKSDFSVDFAESGSTIALAKASASTKDTVDAKAFSNTKYLSIPVDTDYLTISFGINDTALCDLGQLGDTENTTFYGAWDKVLRWLATNRPDTKIGIIIFQRNNNEYYEAVKIIAENYGIPYLDFYGGKDTPMYVDGKAYSVNETMKQKRHDYYCGQQHTISEEETFQGRTVNTIVGDANETHPGYRAHIDESKIIEAFLRRL